MATSDLLARCTFPTPGTPVVCALSGGPDSAALVALATLAELDVTAVHVHHGLRPSADLDADTAERIAGQLGVAFDRVTIDIEDGPNLEARARDARRQVLGLSALTGHTADDQAETVLLNLMRGAGATGLAAMRPGETHPILGLRRTETLDLCKLLDLRPAHDPTNDDPRFRRNRVRHELLPLAVDIADRDLAPLISRTADLLRDDDDFLGSLAAQIDPTDARAVATAAAPIGRRAVRNWLTVAGYVPDAGAIERRTAGPWSVRAGRFSLLTQGGRVWAALGYFDEARAWLESLS